MKINDQQNRNLSFSGIRLTAKNRLAQRHGVKFAEKLAAAVEQLPKNIIKSNTLTIGIHPNVPDRKLINFVATKFYGQGKGKKEGSFQISKAVTIPADSGFEDFTKAMLEVAEDVKAKAKEAVFKNIAAKNAETEKALAILNKIG